MAEVPMLAIVGMHGGEVFSAAAREALANADMLVGDSRHLSEVPVTNTAQDRWPTDHAFADVIRQAVAAATQGRRVCALASGDPGFFGLARFVRTLCKPSAFVIYPAPSSVSLAAARLRLAWDDLVVVSAHGRPLPAAIAEIQRAAKVAVLTSPENSPEVIGRALLQAGVAFEHVAVCSFLGSSSESVVETDLVGLASGTFDGLSVVVLQAALPTNGPTLRWGRATSAFDHRAGMITKPEVRLSALARLDLPTSGVLWDIGAGSGSVAIEATLLAPRLQVFAVESRADDVERIRANVANLGAANVHIVEGNAPDAFRALPDPDRVFVGGGGIDVLDAARQRCRPGAVVVATYAAVDRACQAYERLGNMAQIAVSNAARLPGAGGVRFVADNPVFVVWGSHA